MTLREEYCRAQQEADELHGLMDWTGLARAIQIQRLAAEEAERLGITLARCWDWSFE